LSYLDHGGPSRVPIEAHLTLLRSASVEPCCREKPAV